MKYSKSSVKDNLIDASDVAEILGISIATVRNWVKLGKLEAADSSPLRFDKRAVLGLHDRLESSPYLKQRRNKSRSSENFIPKSYISKKSPNMAPVMELLKELPENGPMDIEDILSACSLKLLKSRGIPKEVISLLIPKTPSSDHVSVPAFTYVEGEDLLGLIYLSLRKLRDKKSTGAYYTPFFVVDKMTGDLPCDGTRICDPACGTGNFLIRLPGRTALQNIYGFDLDPVAVSLARINLALKYGITDKAQVRILTDNIRVLDYLSDPDAVRESFDVIIGNPPWGYAFSSAQSRLLSSTYACAGGLKKPESFALFIERSLDVLNYKGLLTFLLPETMLGSDIYSLLRKIILQKAHVLSLKYLGEVFDKVQCPSIILTLGIGYNLVPEVDVAFFKCNGAALTTQETFKADSQRLTSGSFHLLCDQEEYDIIRRIEAVPHFTLKGQADFALGIVTGSNSSLLQDHPSASAPEPILRGKEIEKFNILPAAKFVKFTPKAFQQCPPEELYRAKEKLFYRFIAREPIVALDREQRLSLNSANVLIPKVPGYSATYIMAVLNSHVMSFYYQKTFRNLKVLRSALESLPIPQCSPEKVREIEELVDRKDYEKLEKTIAECYLLPQFKVL